MRSPRSPKRTKFPAETGSMPQPKSPSVDNAATINSIAQLVRQLKPLVDVAASDQFTEKDRQQIRDLVPRGDIARLWIRLETLSKKPEPKRRETRTPAMIDLGDIAIRRTDELAALLYNH